MKKNDFKTKTNDRKTDDDFGHDARLAEWLEEVGKGAGDDEDETNLKDGQWKGEVERVVTLERSI